MNLIGEHINGTVGTIGAPDIRRIHPPTSTFPLTHTPSTAEFHLYVNEEEWSHLQVNCSRSFSVSYASYTSPSLCKTPRFHNTVPVHLPAAVRDLDACAVSGRASPCIAPVEQLDPSGAQRLGPRRSTHHRPSLMALSVYLLHGTNGKHMLRQSTNCSELEVSEECLSRAHFGQASPDHSFFLSVYSQKLQTDI